MTKIPTPVPLAKEVDVDPETGFGENYFNKPESCRLCGLFNQPGIVKGKGNRNAKIMILGEAPGADEVDWPGYYIPEKHGPIRPGLSQGFRPARFSPFVGGSGRVLNIILEHGGIHRETQTYVTNVCKCRPPNNRLPTTDEIIRCAPFLNEEIEDIVPNVIIALGDTALNVLTGKSKIGLWRGVPIEGPKRPDGIPYKIFPTWHPAFIIRAQYNWAFAVHDMARAKAESAFPEINRIPVHVERKANLGLTRESLLADIRRRGACTFDFETTGLTADSSSIRMCGLVGRPDQANVYDWTLGTQQLFEEIFTDPDIEICGQNVLNFDIPFAEDKGHKVRWTKIFDTMVAFHLCNSSYGQTSVSSQNAGEYQGARGAEKDLSFIASNHTDMLYWKDRDSYKGDLYGVCGLDCIATDRSAYDPVNGLKTELKKYDMLDLYYKHVLPVHPILKNMTRRGVNVDMDAAGLWELNLEAKADELEAALRKGLNDPFLNLNSSPQLQKIIYGDMGIEPIMRMDKKKGYKRPSLDAKALIEIVEKHPENAIIRSIGDVRHLRKMNSTFVQPIIAKGRAHPCFGVSKASNGRFNSWDPNAQNVPETMRNIWIPDDPENDVLISADSSQIEWRNAMVLSGDPVGLELLASGVDNHRAVAAETLGKRIENVDDAERHASKFIVYGLGYGRGADSIAAGHHLPFDFVKKFIGKFFSRFHVFYEWRESLPRTVAKQHFLANPWNRRRWWYERAVTEAYNFPASSTAADQMIEQLLLLDRSLPQGATLRLTVHDEVVINCPKDIVRETILCIRTCMQQTWPNVVDASVHPETVRKFYPKIDGKDTWFVPADIHIGSDWSMCKSKDKAVKAKRQLLEKSLGVEEILG